MTLYKRCACPPAARCDHSWWCEFEIDGQRFRKSTKIANKTKADPVADALRAREVARRAGIALIEAAPRLREFADTYVAWAKRDHPASAEIDARVLEGFCPVVGAHKALDRVTAFDIERWRTARLKKIARTTVNRELNVVRGLFSKAVEWGKIERSPLKKVARYKVDDAKLRVLSTEEIQMVLRQLPADYALLCRVTLECLPRLDEVLNIHKTDIGPSWLQIRRKGGKVDRIPIGPELRSLLLNRLGSRTGHVFGDPVPDRGRTSAAFTRLFKKLGLPDVSHHTMRHTGVTLMLEAGVNPRVIQKLAGWTTLRMLERYGHARDTEMRRAVRITAAVIESPQESPQQGEEEADSGAAPGCVSPVDLVG